MAKGQRRKMLERCIGKSVTARSERLLRNSLCGWMDEALIGDAGDAAAICVAAFQKRVQRFILASALKRWNRVSEAPFEHAIVIVSP